jgi:hypothetical protein
MKRAGRALHRARADLVARIRRLTGRAERHQLLAFGRALVDGVILVVGEPEVVFAVDEDAMRADEHALAPGIQEPAFLVEDDDRVLAAIEDVDPILGIARHASHFDEAPALRHVLPAFDDFVFDAVRAQCHGPPPSRLDA